MNEPLRFEHDPETVQICHEQFLKLFGQDDNPTILSPCKETALPEIVDFDTIYQTSNDEKQEHVVSIMKFADGTQTKCVIDISEGTDNEADDYTAFLTCYCKKILGVDFHRTWRYWLEKKPNQDWKKLMKEITEDKNRNKAEATRKAARERKRYRRMVKQKEMELRAEREARNKLDGGV